METSDVQASQLDDIIRGAYQIVAHPERLAELQDTIERHSRKLNETSAALDAHFEQASQLLELVPENEDGDFSRFGLDGHLAAGSDADGALLTLDERLCIIRVDDPELARGELSAGDDFLDWIASESAATLENLRKLAAGDPSISAVVVRFFAGDEDDRGNLGLAVRNTPKGDEPERVIIRQIGLSWSERDERAFSAAFDLTQAETELVRSLVEGKGVKGFAEARGSQVSTARTQLKRLQKKLAVSTQGEIISLYAGFVGLLSSDAVNPRVEGQPGVQGGELHVRGQTIRYHRYGPPTGRPILLLHGALEGPFLPHKALEELSAQGLNVLVPWMPFYAGTDAKLNAADQINAFAQTLPDLLDEVGIDVCPVIACSLSTAYSFAAISAHPERFSGLVLAGMALPLTQTQDKAAMQPAWRAPLELGARFPRFFELFARTLFRLAVRGEVHQYFDRLFKDSPLDREILREPDVAETMRVAAKHRTDRFGAALAHGFVVMTLEWSDWLKVEGVPVRLIIGGQDVIARPSELLSFAKRHGFETVGPVDTVAGFALFQDPALILREAGAFCPN